MRARSMKTSSSGGPHDRTLHELRKPDRSRASHIRFARSLTGIYASDRLRDSVVQSHREMTTRSPRQLPWGVDLKWARVLIAGSTPGHELSRFGCWRGRV